MARKKYKTTGCARLFFFLIILIPAAYFGAKLIRGGEGIPVIDNFIESLFDKKEETIKQIDDKDIQNEVDRLKRENRQLKQRIDRLEQDLEAAQDNDE